MNHSGPYSNYLRCVAVIVIAALGFTATIGSSGGGSGPADGYGIWPSAAFTAEPTRGPAPLEVAFDASASYDEDGTIVRYEWGFCDDEWEVSGVTTSHTYTTPGIYVAGLSVTDNDGLQDSAIETIIVEGSIDAAFTAEPTSGPPPLEVAFDASASSDEDGTIVSYGWDFGDGQSGTGVTTSHTYTTFGEYTARLTVTNDVGATDSATQDILVGFPTAAFAAEPTSGLPPLEVAFDASASYDEDGTIVRYEWFFPDEDGEGVTATYTFTSPGNHIVVLTVWDNDGLSDTAVQYIAVGAPTAAFTAQPTSGPAPLEVAFDASASSDEDGTIVLYEWDFGDGQDGTGVTITHIYAAPGTYTVRLWVTDDEYVYDRATQDITVEED